MLKLFKDFITLQRTSYKFGLNIMKNVTHILPYAWLVSTVGECQFIYLLLKLPKTQVSCRKNCQTSNKFTKKQ